LAVLEQKDFTAYFVDHEELSITVLVNELADQTLLW